MYYNSRRNYENISEKNHEIEQAIIAGDIEKLRRMDQRYLREDYKVHLNSAAKIGNLRGVQFFAEEMADKREDDILKGAVYAAAGNGHLEVVQYLCQKFFRYYGNDGKIKKKALNAAAKNGHLEVAQYLVEAGADIDAYGPSPIFVAAQYGYLEIVEFLAKMWGGEQLIKGNGGFAALHIAAENGHLDVVQFLVERNVAVDKADNQGETPLYAAAQKGHIEVVRFLVERGVDIDRSNNQGFTPLFVAAQRKHIEIVQFLNKRGAIIDNKVSLELGKHLGFATTREDIVTVKQLIDLGADVNNSGYQFPLNIAVQKQNLEMVKLLLQAGAEVNPSHLELNRVSITPLGIAVQQGNLEIIELLLQANAKLSCESNSPLRLAEERGDAKIIKILLEAIETGSKVDEQDLQYLLFPTIANGDIESLSILLNYRIDIHVYDESGYSTVAVAVKNNHLDICRMLIKLGADYTDKNSGSAPVLIAAEQGYTHFIEYFVKELKLDINSCDLAGANLLQIAIEAGHTELAKWLIENEANIYQTKQDGTNSLYAALQQQNYEALGMLLEAGENLELGEIDKYKFSELVLVLRQNIEPFREFITKSDQSKNLLSQLQILKIFADFYTSEEKLEIEASVQKFRDGCEFYNIASKDGIKELFEEALIYFQSVKETFPKTGVIYNMLALTYMQLGNNEEAQKLIDEAINISGKNVIYLTNKVVLALEKSDFQEAAATLFKVAKLHFSGKALMIDLPNEVTDHPEIMDASSSQFRTEIFARVKNIVESEGKVSEASKAKLHETGIKLITKALKYLSDIDQDLTDEQSVVGAMSDFDRVKNQLDGWFEEMKLEMRGGFTETHKGIAKVSVQLEGDGAYRPEFDPALTGEETAGASSSMDL